jgi:hypothetical protein
LAVMDVRAAYQRAGREAGVADVKMRFVSGPKLDGAVTVLFTARQVNEPVSNVTLADQGRRLGGSLRPQGSGAGGPDERVTAKKKVRKQAPLQILP